MTHSYSKLLKNGIINENPVFIQLLSLCPLLAVTTSAINGLTMGLATTTAMLSVSLAISILRKLIPGEIRIATYVVIIAGLVTGLELVMEAYLPPSINEALGIFIPLIVVNCILFSRAELFASKNEIIPSLVDSFSMGMGLTVALLSIAVIREFIGAGSFFEIALNKNEAYHVLIMILPPGAFFTLGVLLMIRNFNRLKKGGIQK